MIKTFTLKTEELSCTSQSHLIPEVFTTKYNSIIYNPLTSATDMKRKIKQRSSIIPPASEKTNNHLSLHLLNIYKKKRRHMSLEFKVLA